MKIAFLSLFASLLALSCSVGFSINDPQKFSCENSDDCESGYICKSNVCEVDEPDPGGCTTDLDKDGYGTGPDLGECRACKTTGANGAGCLEDFNDDPNAGGEFAYPGAPEICDGIDNDGDGTIDNTETPVGFEPTVPAEGEDPTRKINCASANDCPQANQEGVQVFCQAEKCVAQMTISLGSPECNANPLLCENGTYPTVPAACGGPTQ